jgi:ribosomal protein L37E
MIERGGACFCHLGIKARICILHAPAENLCKFFNHHRLIYEVQDMQIGVSVRPCGSQAKKVKKSTKCTVCGTGENLHLITYDSQSGKLYF